MCLALRHGGGGLGWTGLFWRGPRAHPIAMLTTFETSLRLLSVLLVNTQLGLMLRTSSQIFMKVNMSTLVGIEAS